MKGPWPSKPASKPQHSFTYVAAEDLGMKRNQSGLTDVTNRDLRKHGKTLCPWILALPWAVTRVPGYQCLRQVASFLMSAC